MADDRRDRGSEHATAGRQRTFPQLPSFLAAALVVALSTGVAFFAFGRDQLPDVVMLYLLGIMLVSSRYGFAPSIFAAFVSVAAFNFIFVPPYFTLAVGDLRHAVTFAVMFLVAIVISGLTQRVRNQASVQMALAMERAKLAEESEKARRDVETEQLRNSLLSSVSHDLRTPLAVITGAASTLVDGAQSIDEATRLDLMTTILEESERLNRLIRNLLDMTRLESGTVKVKKEWLPLEEIVGAALDRLESGLAGREVKIELAPNLPLVPCDAVLIEQALINLLENAAKYSSGPIEIRAAIMPGEAMVEVLDRGSGISPGQEARIFDKFHRAVREGSPSGVGLGLAICRAIVAAHGGRIWAQNRDGGGASFSFALPVKGEAPSVALAEALEGTTR